MIFQDPYGSLNPRRRVGSIIGDPFAIHGVADGDDRKREVQELMELVGPQPRALQPLPRRVLRRPAPAHRHRQGAGAAAEAHRLRRAGVGARRLDPGADHQPARRAAGASCGLTYVFITHDLSVVRHVSDRIAVMYLGKIVEIADDRGPARAHPPPVHARAAVGGAHRRTRTRSRGRERIVLRGDLPSPAAPPSGCRFHPRCPKAQERCRTDDPELVAELATGRPPRWPATSRWPTASCSARRAARDRRRRADLSFDPAAAEEGTGVTASARRLGERDPIPPSRPPPSSRARRGSRAAAPCGWPGSGCAATASRSSRWS